MSSKNYPVGKANGLEIGESGWTSELVQLKLNIESSVGDSTSFAAKCIYWEGGSAILSTGDYRHRSRIRCITPTYRSGSLTI